MPVPRYTYISVHHTSRGTINFVSCSSYMHYRVGRNAVALARTLLDYDDDGLTAYAKNLAQPTTNTTFCILV